MIELKEMCRTYDMNIRGVIHVGAWEGCETKAYSDLGIKDVVLIEANPQRYQNLLETLQTGRHCVWGVPLKYEQLPQSNGDIMKGYIAHNYAITDREGTIVFNLSDYDGGTDSIFQINDWGRDSSWVPYQHTAKVEVPTTTLDTLIGEDERYNFLNIDVEGAELLVLKGAEKVLEGIDYILLETQDRVRFEGSCTRGELTEFLIPKGFYLANYFDTGKQWGDCLFIKR